MEEAAEDDAELALGLTVQPVGLGGDTEKPDAGRAGQRVHARLDGGDALGRLNDEVLLRRQAQA